MKKYAENKKEYPLLYSIDSGTWKYSELSPYISSGLLYSPRNLEKLSLYRLWDLEEQSTEQSKTRVDVYVPCD